MEYFKEMSDLEIQADKYEEIVEVMKELEKTETYFCRFCGMDPVKEQGSLCYECRKLPGANFYSAAFCDNCHVETEELTKFGSVYWCDACFKGLAHDFDSCRQHDITER